MAPLLATLLFLLLAAPAAAFDVTTCGQIVPPGEAGVLLNDLDCSAEPAGSDGITLGRKSSLDLQGHTLVTPPHSNEAQNGGVRCAFGERKCRTNRDGITKCKYPAGTCHVFSSSGTGSITGDSGVLSHRHLRIENVTIDVYGTAIFAHGNLVASGVTVDSGVGGGITANKMTLSNVTASNTNDFGIITLLGEVRGTNVTVTGNARGGIRAGKVKIIGLTATGNGGASLSPVGGGVHAGHVTLTDSVVTGNTLVGAPVDIASGSLPRLLGTTCGTSRNYRSSTDEPWGVCADD